MAEEQRTVDEVLLHAFNAARATHPDFNVLESIMNHCARALFPDFKLITPAEYIECLYVIAKYADFITPDVRQAAAFQTTGSAVFEARSGSGSVQ